ncbi:EAL domain-containing protein [Motiliproteus coralliicola]|uniref:cyclic-guanylate-specific phosphodiesterase n=1 Tax=Motiliproteus coralliicola TaxID=2283196 RepID=A0A369WT19_9GAMM|nr:EAL domain-containing protein [Motiliproteus coralliicola]RDE24832.1 EAL domain-containing protein [Motiliproteus coralliicola]
MKLSESQRSAVYALLLSLLLLAVGVGLNQSRSLERMDLLIYDLLMPLHSGSMSDRVVIIAIDDASLEQLGRWPWSRRRHAEMLDTLTEMKPVAVGFDVLFSEPQRDDPDADRLFGQALARNGRTVLSVAPGLYRPGQLIAEILPLPELAAQAAAIGHVDAELDLDGLCRRVFLYSGLSDARWPALTLAMLQLAGTAPELATAASDRAEPMISEAWTREHSLLIPFADRSSPPKIYSWIDVVEGRIRPAQIRGRYVLLGATAAGLGDALATPGADDHELMPGVVLNAHILNALLQNDRIQPLSDSLSGVITGCLAIAIALAVILSPLRIGLLLSALAAISTLALSLALLIWERQWFAPASALAVSLIGWPLWSLWQQGVDLRLRHQLQAQLEHQAHYHLASGLPNHAMLEDRLQSLESGTRAGHPVAGLMVIHFDWPGTASTTLGRPLGDELLFKIGERLRQLAGEDQFVAHLNGDDFGVLLTGLDEPVQVRQLASRLLEQLRQPMQMEQELMLLAPQIGVSVWPSDGQDAMGLLRNAYTAMFKSRIDDSDNLCIYSDDIGRQLKVRSQLEQSLILALERDEFSLYYQPQVCARSGDLVGFETLLRWNNPQLGWVSPETFIPVAEHVGLIIDIGYWVLDKACRQLREWRDMGLNPPRIAVNVSPLQFADPNLELSIRAIVDRAGIEPADLELEITESSLMSEVDRAITVMRRIKQQGMELAIDDFGTGYSSLSNLRNFPLDRLKIDQAFTREIGNSHDSSEITLTILAMGRRLGLKVIAEGVETEEQAEFLRWHGCDEFQGYLYGRPMDAEKIEQLLRSNR